MNENTYTVEIVKDAMGKATKDEERNYFQRDIDFLKSEIAKRKDQGK